MALELMDEHEKGEHVRRWLRENAGSLVGGVAIGLLLIFAWQWWQQSQVQRNYDAAAQYQALVESAEAEDLESAQRIGGALREEFGGTAYSALAQLRLAGLHLDAGDSEAAAAALREATGSEVPPAVAGLAHLRLARLQLAGGDAEASLATLTAIGPDSYAGLAAELRGDALLELSRRDEARTAFEDALTHLQPGAANRSIVELKLAAIAPPAEPEA